MFVVVSVSESTDRNSDMMKQEVTRLQEMLNRLDFKRKVCIRFVMQSCDGMDEGGLRKHLQVEKWQRRLREWNCIAQLFSCPR